MLRLQDYRCGLHGHFEVMLDVNVSDPNYVDILREYPCPRCGEIARGIWIKAPGMNAGYVDAITFGGRTYRRDDVEEMLATESKSTSFYDTEAFRQEFLDRISRNTKRELNGDLAPQEVSKEDLQQLDAAIAAPVDVDRVKANEENFINTFRHTEFKE